MLVIFVLSSRKWRYTSKAKVPQNVTYAQYLTNVISYFPPLVLEICIRTLFLINQGNVSVHTQCETGHAEDVFETMSL